jgi:hypothetical protein
MRLSRFFKQKAIYWGNPVANGEGGYTYDEPVEVAVRWEERAEMFKDQKGEEKVSQAIVYSETDFSIHGYLMLGTLSDIASHGLPEEEENAFLIGSVGKTPNVKGTQFLRKAWL